MDTQDTQTDAYANQMARELAIRGRRLSLAAWIQSEGDNISAPFQSLNEGGGKINISNFVANNGELDITIRGVYEGAVHDVRSKYEWTGFGVNPFQIKAAEINFDLSPQTNLAFDKITLDDQALQELNDVLIEDLGLASDLGSLNLGSGKIQTHIKDKLNSNGKGKVGLEIIDQADRDALEQKDGMYFPDQAEQAISKYIAANPGIETTLNDGTAAPSSFGTGTEVLRIKDDLNLTSNLTGSGILIVEGDFIVPDGVTFEWSGIVLIKPPATDSNPQIDFAGSVTINGSIIALHDAIPNSGHMDVTTFRDYSGSWTSPSGVDKKLWYWNWCMYHKHDYTSKYGNSITYFSTNSSERIHEGEIHLNETLNKLSSNDEVFFELFNTAAHGRGSLTLELEGDGKVSNPVAAGFESSIASPVNDYRSKTFKVSDLKYMHLDIMRLSSLKKMWDTGSKYPNCSSTSGPVCVGYGRDRQSTLTLRMYKLVGASEYKIYEASMYWHRRTDEIDAFNDKMDDLVSSIQAPDYGLDITFGKNVSITADNEALNLLSEITGASMAAIHLGSWSAHWSANDPDNPLKGSQ